MLREKSMFRKMKVVTGIIIVFFVIICPEIAKSALPNFVPLAKDAGKAVVNISTEKKVFRNRTDFPTEMFRGLPPGFERFFEQFERRGPDSQVHKQRSLGTGFIISPDGYIVTNNHVIEGADAVSVNLEGTSGKEESLPAEVIGRDEETDLALLKVKSKDVLPYLSFGDSDKMEVGEWVLAIGNPFGLGHTVTAGILSAKGRDIHAGPFDNFLQTDASINPGNSGGPLINMSGQVIGINTAIMASGQGIGFAIPSSMADRIVTQLKTNKKVSRGWIGVTIQDVDSNTAKALGLSQSKGALIGSVLPGEPADKAGLKVGDIITEADGQQIDSAGGLLKVIATKAPKSNVKLKVWRDGNSKNISIVLGERKSTSSVAQSTPESLPGSLGLSVRSLTEEETKSLELKPGVGLLVVSVDANKPASEAGIREEDVILSANLQPLHSVEELAKIIRGDAKKKGVILLQLQRSGQTFFKTLPVTESN